jgi:hypothetical protein
VIGQVDAAGVVDEVGVDPAALARILDPASLREPEVPSLPHGPSAKLIAVDPDGIVGLVAHLLVGLVRRLDVGPDATVPQEVDRGPQDGADELSGRQ